MRGRVSRQIVGRSTRAARRGDVARALQLAGAMSETTSRILGGLLVLLGVALLVVLSSRGAADGQVGRVTVEVADAASD